MSLPLHKRRFAYNTQCRLLTCPPQAGNRYELCDDHPVTQGGRRFIWQVRQG